MNDQPAADSPSKPGSNRSNTTPVMSETPQLLAPARIDVLLEQYKLAVEMAARMSAKRQEANKFYIAIHPRINRGT